MTNESFVILYGPVIIFIFINVTIPEVIYPVKSLIINYQFIINMYFLQLNPVKVGLLWPVEQTWSYWDRSSALPLAGIKPTQ